MNKLVPNRSLFDFELSLAYRSVPPRITGDLSDWTDAERLPRLSVLDDYPDFADVWACWSDSGLSVACRVEGKTRPLRCYPRSYWTSDCLRICTDMRDARGNRRATRFCQQFFFMPVGGGRAEREPVAGAVPIHRAREPAPQVDDERLVVAAGVGRNGYTLEAHVPADCLSGFDPAEHSRIGFYYIVEDAELGKQYLTVGDDLQWFVDPSTWATAVLCRGADE